MIFAACILPAQIINKTPLSERITGYRITAFLDTTAKTVNCTMEAFWVNKSSDTVPDVMLHLYMNAFRDGNSTFYRESGGKSPGVREIDPGWIEINSLTGKDGTDLRQHMEYVSPDDGNPDDRTVSRIMLPKPAKPGDTVFIRADFITKLPSQIDRTGFNNNFYFVAQWFPKFGVYEPAGMRYAVRGGWNCHQFHNRSEFYSDHSVYEVEIKVPGEYVVGTGGILLSEIVSGKHKILKYRAEDIVDFAWTAWPGYKIITDKWENVNITLLIPPDRIKQAGRHFSAAKHALEFLKENAGPYPWPYMTIVDPPSQGVGASGMEYTTLFTTMSSYIIPSFIHIPETVTIHEFGHSYFMGILASNEFEEPWLDEGVNTFFEERIYEQYYRKTPVLRKFPLLGLPDFLFSDPRMHYISSDVRQTVSNAEYSWNYPYGSYDMFSYYKTTTWLYTLMGIVGENTMNDIFREYYKKWAFKHPSGKDFINVVNEVVKREYGSKFGDNMNWFFDQTLYGTGICDYRVLKISNSEYSRPSDHLVRSDTAASAEHGSGAYFYSVASIERIGEIMLPIEVLVHFSNGDEITEEWDGRARYKDFSYTGNREIEWIKIDPDYKIKMDVNFINNSMTMEPSHALLRRLMNKFMSFLEFYLSFVLF